MSQELNFSIKTSRPENRMFVDKYDTNEVWISIHVHGATCNTTLSFEQAKELVEALNTILATEEA